MAHKGYKQTAEHRAKIAAAATRRYQKTDERLRTATTSRTHGKTGTGAYRSWYAMKRRVKTTQPHDRPYYDGVDMDPRWERFEEFYADMGDRPEGHTLDRIDGSRGYWPGNCRWATRAQQRVNQDRTTRMADCHPDRRHVARGLCNACYKARRRASPSG